MSPFCMFKDIHRVPDYAPVRYDAERFPSFCAEMGAGIQMIYRRRPIVTARAAQALMIRTLGSGSNGIGYYMYHGGRNPNDRLMQESRITGYPNNYPIIDYDFRLRSAGGGSAGRTVIGCGSCICLSTGLMSGWQ